jgi:hypothetical protein
MPWWRLQTHLRIFGEPYARNPYPANLPGIGRTVDLPIFIGQFQNEWLFSFGTSFAITGIGCLGGSFKRE